MATRSIIKINYGDTKLTLYRHHDGYIAEGGYDLSCLLKTYPKATKLITAMINRQRSISSYDVESPLYSIQPCDNMGEEYTYCLDFLEDKLCLTIIKRNYGTLFTEYDTCETVASKFYKYCFDERTKSW